MVVVDEIGELLGVKLVVILIGECLGLSLLDSMGFYLIWMFLCGFIDVSCNCIFNVWLEGLFYLEVVYKLYYLMV